MREMKTAELIGPALDWAVATIEGYGGLRRNPHAFDQALIMNRGDGQCALFSTLKYSTDWALGGPLIEQHRMHICPIVYDGVEMTQCWTDSCDNGFIGPTPLIAAMRCLVASKLGEVVMVPKELLP